jgi:hypothetical protein
MLLTAGGLASAGLAASAATPVKVVRYHGFRLAVPRSWPVYDLARHPHLCLRFNRHAVYLGMPGQAERCPGRAIGRTEAIAIQPAPGGRDAPGQAGAARSRPTQPTAIPAAIGSGRSSSGWWVDKRAGVLITATWVRQPGVVRRALGLHSLRALHHPAGVLPAGVAQGVPVRAEAARHRGASAPGAVYTGRGFDACSTPSRSAMAAWKGTYRAVGVYIGGTNEASCAGKGLTPGWVSRESAAGWHLIPIYVGRQAPSNLCGCQGIAPSFAVKEGRFAAKDAVNQARGLGLGRGNPLYFDMEGYSQSATNTSAVLRFLAAWTSQVHAEGYLSGVYSSGDSGIVDLVSKAGTSYNEPDELWIARWNDEQTTSDPNVPDAFWPNHERLHQYSGGQDEKHGGFTLNIDGDYVDGATAAAGTAAGMSDPPAAVLPPTISGAPVQGQRLTLWHGSWTGVPSSYTEQWEDCDQSGSNCTPIPGATSPRYVVRASDRGYKIRVQETAANAVGEGDPVMSRATVLVLNQVPLYWLRNAQGNVYPSQGTVFYGSPRAAGFRGSSITGAAATLDGRGYWVLSRAGTVFAFGDATVTPPMHHSRRMIDIVAAPGGGYWMYSAGGNVYPSPGTPWYGSPRGSGFRGSSITGAAATLDGGGYWVVSRSGTVFGFGDAPQTPPTHFNHRIIGIVAAPRRGYWLYSPSGNVYPAPGTRWYGSPAASGVHGSRIAGMVATADGRGYWVVDSRGDVFPYGDAARLPAVKHGRHRITGIFR